MKSFLKIYHHPIMNWLIYSVLYWGLWVAPFYPPHTKLDSVSDTIHFIANIIVFITIYFALKEFKIPIKKGLTAVICLSIIAIVIADYLGTYASLIYCATAIGIFTIYVTRKQKAPH